MNQCNYLVLVGLADLFFNVLPKSLHHKHLNTLLKKIKGMEKEEGDGRGGKIREKGRRGGKLNPALDK